MAICMSIATFSGPELLDGMSQKRPNSPILVSGKEHSSCNGKTASKLVPGIARTCGGTEELTLAKYTTRCPHSPNSIHQISLKSYNTARPGRNKPLDLHHIDAYR